MKKLICVIFALLFLVSTAYSATNDTILVGVKEAEPFIIINEDNSVSGFSVDLVNALAQELETTPEIIFYIDEDLPSHLESVENSVVDLGIASTTITSQREVDMDFSHPFYESSLAIMLKENSNKKSIFSIFLHKEILWFFFIVLAVIFLLAHIVWFTERKGMFKKQSYPRAIIRSTWWTIIALMPTTEALEYDALKPRNKFSKVLAQVVVIIGVLAFGIVFAKLASVFTVYELESSIQGPGDLYGQKVGVIVGTQTVDVVKSLGLKVVEVQNLEEGADLLDRGKVDAFIHDKPLLQYHIKSMEEKKFYLVQETFAHQYYGITFPKNSSLREEFNIALLELKESGSYDNLKTFWFE